MAKLVVFRNDLGDLNVKSFRFSEQCDEWKKIQKDVVYLVEIDPISRGAIQQVERHFLRLLSESYIEKIANDPNEVLRILRLYEIGARR